MNQILHRKRNTFIVLLFCIAAAVLFSRGEYWNFSDGVLKEAIFLLADALLVFLIPFIVYRNENLNRKADKFISAIKTDGVSYLGVLLKYAACALISAGAGSLAAAVLGYSGNMILIMMVTAVGFLLYTCFRFRKTAAEHIDKLFLCIFMIVSTFLVTALPAEVGYSWDDQVHFDRTLSMATLNGPYYEADEMVYLSAWNSAGNASKLERFERAELINESYAEKQVRPYNHGDMRHLGNFGYVGYCAGVILARGLSLPYTACFRISKLFNALLYGLLIYFAIRKLRFGKILAAVIGLIPTSMYMACSYSYDPWVTGFIILGYAYFFSALQNRDEKLTNKDIVIMLGAFFVGCLPKAVYFVLMFPLLFMPKDKFASKKQRTAYLIAGFAIAIGLASTFVLPRLMHGAGSGDSRGGSDVNATEQIKYILNNPGEFAQMLFRFITKDYLSAWSAGAYSVNYAYLGADKAIWYLVPSILLFVGLTDKIGIKGRTWQVTLSAMFAFVCTIIVVAASMYISFTPVAYHTVNGCQPRYLIPILFPALYINSFDRLRMPDAIRNLYSAVPVVMMGIINAVSIGMILVNMY